VAAATVQVHVASLNTAGATELCVRTIHRFAGRDFDLVVGDSGSTDRTLSVLRGFEHTGWLRLEVEPEGRRHAQWLDHWLATCPARYAVFVDSDMQFRDDGWLRDLVDTAERDQLAMVTSRVQTLEGTRHNDKQGRPVRWAPRPTPWLILVDVEQVRPFADTSFGFRYRDDPNHPGGRIAYDTGAFLFDALQRNGLSWAAMPDGWSSCYHHFGGMTWITDEVATFPRRIKQRAKRVQIFFALQRARATARRPYRG
jgi:glycosyltransferase involved in cell wall biosynthesis